MEVYHRGLCEHKWLQMATWNDFITGQYGATFAHKISPWSMVMYGIGIIFGVASGP